MHSDPGTYSNILQTGSTFTLNVPPKPGNINALQKAGPQPAKCFISEPIIRLLRKLKRGNVQCEIEDAQCEIQNIGNSLLRALPQDKSRSN
jgi:hypothetical protein